MEKKRDYVFSSQPYPSSLFQTIPNKQHCYPSTQRKLVEIMQRTPSPSQVDATYVLLNVNLKLIIVTINQRSHTIDLVTEVMGEHVRIKNNTLVIDEKPLRKNHINTKRKKLHDKLTNLHAPGQIQRHRFGISDVAH